MKGFIVFVDEINKYLVKIVGVCMIFMAIFVTIQVFSRYILGFSYPWTEELARYLMIIAAFLGAGVAVRRSKLIALEALVQFTPKKISKIIQITAQVLSIIFYILLLKFGIDMLLISGDETAPVTKIPMYLIYGVLPISVVIMFINECVVFIEKQLLIGKE